MADDLKSTVLNWLKDKVDLVFAATWMLTWGIVMLVLLWTGHWDFAQKGQKYVLYTLAIAFAGATGLMTKAIIATCSRTWKKHEIADAAAAIVSNRKEAIGAMTDHQRLVVACFVEAGERELRLDKLYAAFLRKLDRAERENGGNFFQSALHSLQDQAYISGVKFMDDHSHYFQELDKNLFDYVVGNPKSVSANTAARNIVRKV